jgi:hypothetical protein
LGRSAEADRLFLRVLLAAAQPMAAPKRQPCAIHLLWPPAAEVKPEDRPVLASALAAAKEPAPDRASSPGMLTVLDLRGPAPPGPELEAAMKAQQEAVGPDQPLLILGDDPALDRWTWLKLDRTKAASARPDVIWLPDDTAPGAWPARIRLMQVLTEYGIPLELSGPQKGE